jgi:hypothetical protein
MLHMTDLSKIDPTKLTPLEWWWQDGAWLAWLPDILPWPEGFIAVVRQAESGMWYLACGQDQIVGAMPTAEQAKQCVIQTYWDVTDSPEWKKL